MNRRGFVACGVAAAVTGVAARANNNADALSIERSTLVVNGLDTSSLTPEYLQLLRKGGVSCMHGSTGGSLDAFASMLAFFDQHSEQIAPAGSVREIRRLHQQGKLSHVSG